MERVKRKECDTWKIVDSAHEAGFILTLVVFWYCNSLHLGASTGQLS